MATEDAMTAKQDGRRKRRASFKKVKTSSCFCKPCRYLCWKEYKQGKLEKSHPHFAALLRQVVVLNGLYILFIIKGHQAQAGVFVILLNII